MVRLLHLELLRERYVSSRNRRLNYVLGSQGGRYEGSKENSSGIDRYWQLGLVRTCPGAEAFAGVRDRSYLQPTQGSGEGGRYRVWHSSRSREFGCVGEGPIGRPGPGANHLSATWGGYPRSHHCRQGRLLRVAAYADCGQICRVGDARRCCRSENPDWPAATVCTGISVCS